MLTALRSRSLDWSSAPLHPLLVAAYPVLFLFAENAEQQVTLAPLWLPLMVCLAGGVGATLVLSLALRDWQRGGLLASLLLTLFFSFGHVWNLVEGALGQRWLLGAIWLAVALVGGLVIWRGGRWVAATGRFLNVAALLLVAFNLVRVANYASVAAAAGETVAPPDDVQLTAPDQPPDIYYIILDRYANVETLRDQYDFDNEPFMRELEERGFAVARNAWANYFKTALSLYSSLSMKHIDPEELGVTDPPHDFKSIFAALRDHLAVPVALKSIGYDYIHLGSWWEPTATNIDADISLRFEESSEFSGALFSTTLLSLFSPPAETGGDDDGETITRRDQARGMTLFAFDRLEESAGRGGPTFVFAHILLPHPPYIFNADGSVLAADVAKGRNDRVNYVEHVRFANARVLEAIDALLRGSGSDPIIILQADEGPWPRAFSRQQGKYQWLDAPPEDIQRKFGILNAIHLPDGIDPADFGFTDGTSPVNEFRIVFNAIFDADMPLLPDVTYLSPDYARMYDFVPYPHD
ncbi:MAG TPA: hypothetical protein VFH90_06485 [Candidatus Limnocylindria bacterium]|nr:hypothetical protein [Candidatus Limnocylindria bacterium]